MEYWTVHYSVAERYGFLCRECHKYINKGEPIIQRDGRKIRLIYHKDCFSGDADPRTQANSSYNSKKFPQYCFRDKAPKYKY